MSKPFDSLLADLRFAVRYFARHKGTTAIIVTVLALATGANTVIFSIFQSQFLRPAPAVPSTSAHTRIFARERKTATAEWEQRGFTRPELTALAARREVFQHVAAWTADEIILGGGDSSGARGVNAQFVTPNYFATLGVPLAFGPGFAQNAGDAADPTGVMANAMAVQLYGAAAAAVGRNVLVNEVPVRIVGVAPPRFQGALRNMDEPALWMPVSARAAIAHISPRWLDDEAQLSLFAQLAPSATRERATALARLVVARSLPDSAGRLGMARTADVLALNAPPPGNELQ